MESYKKFGNNIEMPSAYVKVKNQFALRTVLNKNENPVKITFNKPLKVEVTE